MDLCTALCSGILTKAKKNKTDKSTFFSRGLLTRFAFKGDKEEFSGPWT